MNYIEKPTYSFQVSMGVNVFNRDMVSPYLIPGKYLDIPDLMKKMVQDNLPVLGLSRKLLLVGYWSN